MALAFSISALILLETRLRRLGHSPSVSDDTVAWVEARRSAEGDSRVVAFVGGSRLQLAISLDVFRAFAPEWRGVQLALNGVPSLGVFEDLANDPDFHGVAVVDVTSWELADGHAFDRAASWVKRDEPLWRMPGAVVNRALALPVQEHLVTLAIGGRSLLMEAIEHGALPPPAWTTMTRDRVRSGHYEPVAVRLLQRRDRRAASSIREKPPTAWMEHLPRIERDVAAIRQRGGDVVFVHPPIAGRIRARSDELYPRGMYWDPFARATSAHTIHFADVPAMALPCPDGMHLDGRDQALFTRALVTELRARHVL